MALGDLRDDPPDLDDALAPLSAEELADLDRAIKAGFSPVLAGRHRTATTKARSPSVPSATFTPHLPATACYPARAYLHDPDSEDELNSAILNAARFVILRRPTLAHEHLVREVHEFLFGGEPLTRLDRLHFLQSVAAAIAGIIHSRAIEVLAAFQTVPARPLSTNIDSAGAPSTVAVGRADTSLAADEASVPSTPSAEVVAPGEFPPGIGGTTGYLLAEKDPARISKRMTALHELDKSDPTGFMVFSLAEFAGASDAAIAELLEMRLDDTIQAHIRAARTVFRAEILNDLAVSDT